MSKFKVSAPESSKVQNILSLARQIEAAIESEKDCDALLAEMKRLTGGELYDREFFRNLYKHTDLERFAVQAAYSPATKRLNITRDELVEVMQLAMGNIGEPSFDYYLALFDANIAMPGASNLLFYLPDDWPYSSDEPSAEEIVDYALAYKIIAL